jgi:prepilin-type N-terminal cleavage/methylation domain-containing protein
MTRHARGFTLVELLVAMAVMVTFSGALMSLILAGQTLARVQPEAADLQQRARIALQTLGAELARAGAGLDRGPQAGPLVRYFPPIGPSPDGGLTVWYVSSRDGQSTLTAPLAPGATDARVAGGVFTAASTAIVLSAGGCRDVLRVDTAAATVLQIRAGARTCAYAAGAAIAQGEVRTYLVDTAARQLLRRDEATGLSVPVLDNVTAMSAECLDGCRRVRMTLRLTPALPDPRVPEFEIALDVRPPNLQPPPPSLQPPASNLR